MSTTRRICFFLLCIAPFMIAPLGAIRALRTTPIHQAVGGLVFLAVGIASWTLGARAILGRDEEPRLLAAAGALLVAPFALIGLLWVGLGTPWQATRAENMMRYVVLVAGAISVSVALVVLTEALRRAGETFLSTLGFAANMLAGAAYVVWTSFQLGAYVTMAKGGDVPPAITVMGAVNDVLLFVACALTYAATAAFAAALGRLRWLGRGAAGAYVGACGIVMAFLMLRGLAFPDPGASAQPWYTQPGFIAGIPAMPWIMPFLLGVVLLRRAGDGKAAGPAA